MDRDGGSPYLADWEGELALSECSPPSSPVQAEAGNLPLGVERGTGRESTHGRVQAALVQITSWTVSSSLVQTSSSCPGQSPSQPAARADAPGLLLFTCLGWSPLAAGS